MPFDDRVEAARLLGSRLQRYRGSRPLVLAIPRGAVPMGKIVAEALDGDLDVVLVRKLGAPDNPELAIGSIDETGAAYLYPGTRSLWDRHYLEIESARQLAILMNRRARYRASGPRIDPAGRVAIVLDDGIATGSTMIAALRAVRARGPARLVAATAVAPAEAVAALRREADDVICLEVASVLYAIGYHFRDFSQVSDEEVIATLAAARALRATAASASG